MSDKKESGPRRKRRAKRHDKPSNEPHNNNGAKSSTNPESISAKQKYASFPIIGIGASAGGLEAFESFFDAMPVNSGMAFVLVAHLDPSHVSLLPELLQRHTQMQVSTIRDGTRVRPDHVYVIPPNKDLRIFDGVLYLFELMHPHGANLPIDSFFRSLAEDRGANAICIILSGTGTDGTLGLKAIKGGLGMVMAQDEETAKYDGMPRSAIATGLVDYVLPTDKMPVALIDYVQRTSRKESLVPPAVKGRLPDNIHKILIMLRGQTGHDFSLYKRNTIFRRIERRMNLHRIDDIADYIQFLQQTPSEVNILFKELLIGVTSFFRDPEAYAVLKENFLCKLLQEKPSGYTVRVWVPACSSGEEAYSVAILLQESMEKIDRHFTVQIFGTDIDEEAIEQARKGLYPPSISADVEPGRLERYFRKEEDGQYRINKAIREMLLFATQNIIKDPPFTKLDLICCRNLLIYFSSELQQKLLPVFHYSLRPDGILFLGTSETIGPSDLFITLDKKWRIFRRKAVLSPHIGGGVGEMTAVERIVREKPETIVSQVEGYSAIQLVESILRASGTSPCVIINDDGNIIYIHGKVGRFLELPEGKANLHLLSMAGPGLKTALTTAVRKAESSKQEVVYKDIRIGRDDGYIKIDLTVKPLLEQSPMCNLMMVVFDEIKDPLVKKAEESTDDTKTFSGKTVVELEQELHYTRQTLQSTIEELETSNEELKSANEELQSTNEELQSTNEELETSKEELQSLNEESITVNAELQNRIDELSQANDDMKNLLDSTEIATIFLDSEMGIRRFTPKATDIIPLALSDIGRPIHHLASNLVDVELSTHVKQVLADLATFETEVKCKDGGVYYLRIRPYRTVDNVIDGVVMTFDEITKRKEIEAELKRSQQMLLAFQVTNDAVWQWDIGGDKVVWNVGYSSIFGEMATNRENTWQWRMEHIHPEDRTRVEASIQSAINGDSDRWQEEFRYCRSDDTYVVVIDRAYIQRDENGKAVRMLGAMLDISQFKDK